MVIKKICWLIAILAIAFSGEFSHASVAPKATKITVKVGKGGAIYPAKKTSLSSGESKTFSVEPDIRNGYHITNILIDGQAVSVGNAYIPFKKTFNYDGKNHSIKASFALNEYEVSLIAGPGGVISPTMQTITHGTKKVVFFVKPDIDFNISDVKINGISKGPISQVAIDVVTRPLEITATFENKYISVTSSLEGVKLCSTQRYRLSWEVKIPSSAAKIDLLFSRDGGSTWENIATLPANTTPSSYDWIVPNVLSYICKIKVAMIDNMGNELHSAVTNYNFKITNVPVLRAISVVPSSTTLPLNISAQFQAIGNYFCGSEQDITGMVSWSVGDNSIAVVEDVGHSTGILQTINEGRTVFNASLDNLQGSSAVYVVPVQLLDIDLPAQSGRFVTSPVVSINEAGNGLVSYLDTGKVIVVEHDVQEGWLQKEEVNNEPYRGSWALKIATNNSGGRLVAWRASHDVYVSTAPAGGNFGAAVSIAQPYSDHGYVYAGLDSDGDGLIVWTDWSNAIMSYTIYSSRYDHVIGIWSTPEYLGTRGWSDGPLHLAVSSNGSAILLWNAWNVDRDGVWKYFATNFSKSTGWQQPLELYTSNVYGTESVDINDRGDAIVVWSEWRLNPDSNSMSLHAAFYSHSEGWQPQQRINTGSNSFPSSPMLKMNQNNEAVVLWFNTEYSGLYTLHVNTYHPLSGWSNSTLIRPLGMVGAPTLYTPFIDNDGNKLVLWHPESLMREGCIEMRRSTSSGGWGNIEGLDMVEIMACTSPSLISVASNSQGKGIIAWQLPMLFLNSQGMLESVIYNFASAKFGL